MPTSEDCYLDTNVIIEATRTTSLAALTANRKNLVTVEKVVEECATGRSSEDGYVKVDVQALRATARVEQITQRDLIDLRLRLSGIASSLDPGEENLLAAAVKNGQQWCICSPDRALIRACKECNCLDRVISLEELLREIGQTPRPALRKQYTKAWMGEFRTELLLEDS